MAIKFDYSMALTRLGSICALTLGMLLAGAADFPSPFNSEPDTNSAAMPAAQVAAQMTLPPGFKATVFAAEPDVQNPIALAWDARGRLWVAENYTYAERARKFELSLRDRILLFEDKDGDGHEDFDEGVNVDIDEEDAGVEDGFAMANVE